MNRQPRKPCKWCGNRSPTHYPYQCFKNPKVRKTITTRGKYAKQWEITRATWFKQNPPIPDPYPHYICYLPGHGEWLLPPRGLDGFDNPLTERVTLDHVLSRGRHPELRAALHDLRPCCYAGNNEKGSKDGVL